jgi:hypothetical protein
MLNNNPIKYLFLILLSILLIEFISFIMSVNNLLLANITPNFYLKNKVNDISKFWTEEEPWGAWHKKNYSAKYKTKCFEVNYSSNEYGARDKSFQNISKKKNFILIGDSFAEGYGVNYDDMSKSLIEKQTGLNILNFGTSKDFGPVNYYLIYEKLAKNFPHEGIIIFLLPNNDFRDNDYNYFKKTNNSNYDFGERYRPYYKKNDTSFEIFYPEKAIKNSDNRSLLKDYLWFYNVLRTIKIFIISSKKKDFKLEQIQNLNVESSVNSGYFVPTKEQQEATIHFIKKIINSAKNKKIYLISIPLTDDYENINIKNIDRNKMLWWSTFKHLDSSLSNFYFIDLADYRHDDFSSLFYPDDCDGHWNKKGNIWAAKIISNYINKNKKN